MDLVGAPAGPERVGRGVGEGDDGLPVGVCRLGRVQRQSAPGQGGSPRRRVQVRVGLAKVGAVHAQVQVGQGRFAPAIGRGGDQGERRPATVADSRAVPLHADAGGGQFADSHVDGGSGLVLVELVERAAVDESMAKPAAMRELTLAAAHDPVGVGHPPGNEGGQGVVKAARPGRVVFLQAAVGPGQAFLAHARRAGARRAKHQGVSHGLPFLPPGHAVLPDVAPERVAHVRGHLAQIVRGVSGGIDRHAWRGRAQVQGVVVGTQAQRLAKARAAAGKAPPRVEGRIAHERQSLDGPQADGVGQGLGDPLFLVRMTVVVHGPVGVARLDAMEEFMRGRGGDLFGVDA